MSGSRWKIVMKTNPKLRYPPTPQPTEYSYLLILNSQITKNRDQFPLENKTFPRNHTPYKKYPDPRMLNTCMVQCTLKCRITICLSYVSSRRSLLKRPQVLVVHLRNIARCFPSPNCKKTKKVYLKSIYQSII